MSAMSWFASIYAVYAVYAVEYQKVWTSAEKTGIMLQG